MMLVSVLSFCQYPTTKVINGEPVVIMTLKQGQDINYKFKQLGSEIKDLENEVRKNNVDLRDMETRFIRLNRDFQFTRDSLHLANTEKIFYKKEYERIKNLEFADKKARLHMRIGILVLTASWITFILTSVK